MEISKEKIKGTLKLFILETLSNGDDYGYGIAQSIKKKTEELLTPTEGSIYPALYKLESEGYISSRWDKKYTPERKYYCLTSKGRRLLKSEKNEWSILLKKINLYLSK